MLEKRRFGEGSQEMWWFLLVYFPLLALPCDGFLPNFWSQVLTLSWDSSTHQNMTEWAILTVIREVQTQGLDLSGSLVKEELELGRPFWRAVGEVVSSNADTDFSGSTKSDPVYHFDSERISDGMLMLRELWVQTVLSVRAREHQSARHSLGQLLHSLQDFYSHSNWVEMGQTSIYLHLMQPEEPAVPIAKKDNPACMDCFTATCRHNLLPAMLHSKLLTTGYTGSSKPQGKCSHGGILDSSAFAAPKGGINKDSTSPVFSPHHYLHKKAASLATEATAAVLRDLKDTVGGGAFLRLFSVRQKPALVFVMDTTGSMFEEITAARLRALSIIQSRASSRDQAGTFVLVPFHDPEVGPVYEADDPDTFMQHMESLMALGGGDEPEMCLTGILLALTHSPPLSDIFVFTDASPKDAHLFDAVKALALKKQSKITFLLTEDPYYTLGRKKLKRRRKRSKELPPPSDRFALYSSLSSLSGGLTIFTTDSDIHMVSTVVEDNTAADQVTLFHAESDDQLLSDYSFRVDSSVQKVIFHVTGTMTECILTSPSDQSQHVLMESGPIAELQHFQGLYRISLLPPVQPGHWKVQVRSDGHVTFNVIGDSSVGFLYYFATVANETHPGLGRVQGSPIAGTPAFLVLHVTTLSSDEGVSVSHATLLGAKGESLQQVKLNHSSSFHSWREAVGLVESVPTVPFCVRLTGRDNRGNELERVSSKMVQPTHVEIQMLPARRLVPGHITTVRFDILNHGPARLFNLSADDDCGYLQKRGTQRFPVAEQGSFRGQVELLTPATARAGATVTLTLTVHDLDSPDSNFAVAYLTVVPPDPDTFPPSCSAARVQSSCPNICSQSSWSVLLALSDDGQTGLAAVQLQKGEGLLTVFYKPPFMEEGENQTDSKENEGNGDRVAGDSHYPHRRAWLRTGEPALNVSEWALGLSQPLWVNYTSSCCSARAELLLWDAAGNMKRCRLMFGEPGSADRSAESSGNGQCKVSGCVFLLLSVLLTLLI